MPSHTFVDLGMWEEAIESNKRSMEAALAYDRILYKNDSTVGSRDPISEEFAHALSFLSFAQMQLARDGEVRTSLETFIFDKEGKKYAIDDGTVADALASIALRYYIERDDWAPLESFQLMPSYFPWATFPWANLFTSYARTMSYLQRKMLSQANDALHKELNAAWEAWTSSSKFSVTPEDWKAPLVHSLSTLSLSLSLSLSLLSRSLSMFSNTAIL